jgi:hypothetical protein
METELLLAYGRSLNIAKRLNRRMSGMGRIRDAGLTSAHSPGWRCGNGEPIELGQRAPTHQSRNRKIQLRIASRHFRRAEPRVYHLRRIVQGWILSTRGGGCRKAGAIGRNEVDAAMLRQRALLRHSTRRGRERGTKRLRILRV